MRSQNGRSVAEYGVEFVGQPVGLRHEENAAACAVHMRWIGYHNMFHLSIEVLDARPSAEELQNTYFANLWKTTL